MAILYLKFVNVHMQIVSRNRDIGNEIISHRKKKLEILKQNFFQLGLCYVKTRVRIFVNMRAFD